MMKPARLMMLLATVGLGSACASGPQNELIEINAEQCAAATPWAAGQAYATGAAVSYAGSVYVCTQGHTSQPDWNPAAVPALWGLTGLHRRPGHRPR